MLYMEQLGAVVRWARRHPGAVFFLEASATGLVWSINGAPEPVLGALAALTCITGAAKARQLLREHLKPRANRRGDMVGGVSFAAEDELINLED